ncbi:hypothetical protein TD95_002748 [Thielaviopsis punctulata]|uniref:Uncharacterized protein n=1 Tax=Thielaviopsis punctulata TaxID=72032 RepID=A0A0F4ZL44_9PEZI|nr:hypothetical protein TD95_002748 [Thielaviopsis punctulata]
MDAEELTSLFGPSIEDPDEAPPETFLLFSETFPSGNLGFIDPHATTIPLTIHSHDLLIHQSPSLLSSTRSRGTTGAVIWKVTPILATWLLAPTPLRGVFDATRTHVLELGCGAGGVLGLAMCRARRVRRYVFSDQAYVARLLRRNVEENAPCGERGLGFVTLDWEETRVVPAMTGTEGVRSFDVVVACDCVYNDALVGPFVETCVDVCRLRSDDSEKDKKPTLCIVAQQLRDSDVFEAWMNEFHKAFQVWRVPDEMLPQELQSGSGFSIHLGILRT